MSDNSLYSNKRIAKNTFILYLRMFIVLGVNLFTSRLVLQGLGVSDYGIYNVVGGVVVLFSFISNTMGAASLRFFSYELGLKESGNLNEIYNIMRSLYLVFAVIVVILAETIGLWFVNNVLEIPDDRMVAANWVYQFSILGFIIGIVRIPYIAIINAFERMTVYAYTMIFDVAVQLFIAYAILYYMHDKLILYGFLRMIIAAIMCLFYMFYVNRYIIAVHFHFVWNSQKSKEIASYCGLSMLGASSTLASNQGASFLINVYGSLAANASMGMANQVSAAVNRFVGSFQSAFNPQIVKLYASREFDNLFALLNRTSRFSFFLLLVIMVPLAMNLPIILDLWLVEVPEYTSTFCYYLFAYFLLDAAQAPFWMVIYATGFIKKYQIVVSFLTIMNVPLSWFALFLGAPIEIVLFIRVLINFSTCIARMIIVKQQIRFPIKDYLIEISRISVVFITVFSLSLFVKNVNLSIQNSFVQLIIETIIFIAISIFVIYSIGLKKRERTFLSQFLYQKVFAK